MSYLICLISGVLTALPFIFDSLWWLAWISIVPFFYVLIKDTPKYRHGLVFSLGYYGVLYHWFTALYPMDFAGLSPSESALVCAAGWIGFALIQSLGTALIAPLFRLSKGKKRWLYPVMLAAWWTILEWAQSLTFAGIPFFRLAISQVACRQMIQGAALFGSLFVGTLIAFSNACFALGFLRESEDIEARKEKERKKFKFKPNVAAAVGASVMALNFLFGLFFMLYYVDNGEDIPVAVIQGNISSVEKWKSYSVMDCCDIYCDLTRKAVEESDAKIVVWPETVINVQIDSAEVIKNQISELSVECDAYIVVGTFSAKTDGEGKEEIYNSQYLFLPDGRISETVYSKRKLVPFGEYMPMEGLIASIVPTVSDVNIMQNDLDAGSDSEIFDTVYGKIGGIICFDSIYDSIVRDSVRDGAQLIALSTNDSWYRDSAAVYQHNKHAVLRAVESGRYLLRAANTGISSIISPTGEVMKSIGAQKEGYITENIVFRNSATPYARSGNVIVFFSVILMGMFVAFKYTFVKHDKKEPPKPINRKKGKTK